MNLLAAMTARNGMQKRQWLHGMARHWFKAAMATCNQECVRGKRATVSGLRSQRLVRTCAGATPGRRFISASLVATRAVISTDF